MLNRQQLFFKKSRQSLKETGVNDSCFSLSLLKIACVVMILYLELSAGLVAARKEVKASNQPVKASKVGLV